MAAGMAVPRVCVFSSVPGLLQGVRKALPGVDILSVNVPAGSDSLQNEERCKIHDVEILLTETELIVKHNLMYLPNLKWMQSTWAGVDPFIRALDKTKPYPTYQLTRAGSVFGPHLAEFVVAQIIAHERKFSQMARDQQKKQWNQKKYTQYRLLSKLTLGVLGLGGIGSEIARAAKCFGMKVWGYGTQEGAPRTPCQHVDQYRGPSGLSELLAASDYVCSVLPSTPATKGLLSGEVLATCKDKSPVLINVGRGDVISEDSIIKALGAGWLSAAVLDVFETEPLPETSPLWSHPNVTIAPHVSGVSQAWQTEELFIENYKRYTAGKPLNNVVNWDAGY